MITSKVKKIFILVSAGIFTISPAYADINIPGVNISSQTTAAGYIIQFFNLAIIVGALIAVVVLIMAGVNLLTAAGDVGKIEDSKGKIRNVFLGLALLLGSYIFLNIINPQLTQVKINQLSNTPPSNIQVPEGSGIYLYDSPNFTSANQPLIVTESKPSLVKDNFQGEAKSIKIVNPTTFKFGAVLFSDSDLRGYCSWTADNLTDLSQVAGQENNPPVSDLQSLYVFKEDPTESATVTIYNTINCQPKSNDYCIQGDRDYPCETDANKECAISSSDGLQNIRDVCPNFKGDVLSVGVGPTVGVLLKAADKGAQGGCQFFESESTSCLNVVKYSYVYNPAPGGKNKPYSIMIFPLVR